MECINCNCVNRVLEDFESGARALLKKAKRVNRMNNDKAKDNWLRELRELDEYMAKEAEKLCAEATNKPKNKVEMIPVGKISQLITEREQAIKKEAEAKKAAPPQKKCETKGYVYNKYTKEAMSLDFEVPSLPYDKSSEGVDKAVNEDPSSLNIAPIPVAKEMLEKEKKEKAAAMKASSAKPTPSQIQPSVIEKPSLPLFIEKTYKIVKKDKSVEHEWPLKVFMSQRCDDKSYDCHFSYFDGNGQKLFEIDVNFDPKKGNQDVYLDRSLLNQLFQ